MARFLMNAEKLEKLLAAYREKPADHVYAAASAGIARTTAKKVWEQGIDYMSVPPLRTRIKEEMTAARAGLLDKRLEAEAAVEAELVEKKAVRAHEEAEKARADAIHTRRQEAEIVRNERSNVAGMIGIVGHLVKGALKQAAQIEKEIEEGKDETTGIKLSLKDRLDGLKNIGTLVKQCGEAAESVVKLERLLLGEPTDIVGVKRLDVGTDEALKELEEAGAMAARMKDRQERRLRLVQGGG